MDPDNAVSTEKHESNANNGFYANIDATMAATAIDDSENGVGNNLCEVFRALPMDGGQRHGPCFALSRPPC